MILNLKEYKIQINCKLVSEVDFILLTDCTIHNILKLPLVLKLPNIPIIYATTPIINMGRLCLKEYISSLKNQQEFNDFSAADVDAIFNKIIHLKFNQIIMKNNLILQPIHSAHTIGGTIWKLKYNNKEIIIALHYNHKKERHLDQSKILEISRPDVLITDAFNVQKFVGPRQKRDADLMNGILNTLKNDGNVLIPVDSTARVLELAYLLESLWQYHQLTFPLVLWTGNCKKTMEYAKSMLEWMGENVTKHFATTRETPFDFKYMKLIQSKKELDALLSPKVVLCTSPFLEYGNSRDLLVEWSSGAENLVILTQRSFDGNMLSDMFVKLCEKNGGICNGEEIGNLKLEIRKRIPLENEELKTYLAQLKDRKEQELSEMTRQLHTQKMMEGDDESDGEELDLEGELGDEYGFMMQDLSNQLLFLGSNYDYIPSKNSNNTQTSFFTNDSRVVTYPLELIMDDSDEDYFDPNSTSTKSKRRKTNVKDVIKRKWQKGKLLKRRKRIDEYGEELILESFEKDRFAHLKRVDTTMIENGLENTMEVDDKVEEDQNEVVEGEDDEEEDDILDEEYSATKCIVTESNIKFNCRFMYIDYEGLSDGKSIKTIIQQVSPKKLIIVGPDVSKCEELKESLINVETIDEIEIFDDSNALDKLVIESDSNVYQIKLTDALVSSLKMTKLHDYEIASITGVLHFPSADIIEKKENIDKSEATDKETNLNMIPYLEMKSNDLLWQMNELKGKLIGDMKLTELKRILMNEFSLTSVFEKGGKLVVGADRLLRVSKICDGELVLEGCFCKDYYKVRSAIYKLHAVL